MRLLGGNARGALVALCILAAACGDDDDKDGPELLPDGAVPGGSDQDSGLGGGMDGSFVRPDAAVLAPDGAILNPVDGAIVPPTNGPDAAVVPCGGSCDDKVDCTVDRCVENKCTHSIDDSVCTAGSSCSLTMGCQQGKTCAMTSDCADTDGCTTNERCNVMLARCEHDVLDRDGDGDAPVSCGGTDCNDSKGLVGPGNTESCDNEDDDCDGVVDDNASCPTGKSCTMGECACTAGLTQCGGGEAGSCFDLKTNPQHCGGCNESCGSGGACTDGACSCPAATGTMCGDNCSNTKASSNNCGGCGMDCPLQVGGQVNACLDGVCTACGGEGQACCANATASLTGCSIGLSCDGQAGAPGAKCTCASGTKCEGTCTDLRTSELNCGACGVTCQIGQEVCLAKGETASCVACGGVGEPCCDVANLLPFCRGGAACGANKTCVRVNVPQPGGGGGGQ